MPGVPRRGGGEAAQQEHEEGREARGVRRHTPSPRPSRRLTCQGSGSGVGAWKGHAWVVRMRGSCAHSSGSRAAFISARVTFMSG